MVKLRPYLSVPGRRWVTEVEIGQQTAGPRPRSENPHTHHPEPEEEPEDILVSDNFADDYTDMPPPNLPPGYVDNAREEDPPPAQSEPSTSSSEPRPSTSGLSTSNAPTSSSRRGPKRRLATEPSSDNSGKRQRKK